MLACIRTVIRQQMGEGSASRTCPTGLHLSGQDCVTCPHCLPGSLGGVSFHLGYHDSAKILGFSK